MKEYGVVESWVKQYNIEEMFITSLLRFMYNGYIAALLEIGIWSYLSWKKITMKRLGFMVLRARSVWLITQRT